MAFDPEALERVYRRKRGGQTLWWYLTSDTFSSIYNDPGYWSPAANRLKVADIILMSCGYGPEQVSCDGTAIVRALGAEGVRVFYMWMNEE